MRMTATVIALCVVAVGLIWALQGFVVGKIGGAPPCEVSNTCR